MPGRRAIRWLAALAIAAGLLAQLVFSARSLAAAYYAARGDAARLAGDLESAREAYHRANGFDSSDGNRLRDEAAATHETRGPKDSAPIYAAALKAGPYIPLTLIAGATNYIELKRLDEADAVLDTAMRVGEFEWRVRMLRGTILTERAKYADAVRELSAAAELASPPEARVHYELARALHGETQYEQAMAHAERAAELQPLVPEYRLLRGKSLMALNRAPEAVPDLARAVFAYRARLERGENAMAELFEAEDLYALALLAGQQFEQAELAFGDMYVRCTPEQIDRLAIHLQQIVGEMWDPFPQQSLWAFALDLLAQTRHLAEFEATLAAARMVFPESELQALIAPRARALTASGDPEGAIRLLATSPLQMTDTPPYRLALAEAQAAAGRPALARIEYELLLGAENLAPMIQRQAKNGLAALPAR
jgi:tetratricopeptide (TPR) repeat protein